MGLRDVHAFYEEENLLAKRKIVNETNPVEEAFNRLYEARVAFAVATIKDAKDGRTAEMQEAEQAYLAAYYDFLDAEDEAGPAHD
jgi:hypothetical protein